MGLSSTKLIFYDFLGPGKSRENIQDFPGRVGTPGDARRYPSHAEVMLRRSSRLGAEVRAAADRNVGKWLRLCHLEDALFLQH